MQNISQDQWKKQLESDSHFVILDVRTPEECAEGIQKKAQCLNIMDTSVFMQGLELLDKTKTYYVYCRSGSRSAQACMIMDQMGFNKTYNLIGGMLKWRGEVEVG